jgi:hypothetical protein
MATAIIAQPAPTLERNPYAAWERHLDTCGACDPGYGRHCPEARRLEWMADRATNRRERVA